MLTSEQILFIKKNEKKILKENIYLINDFLVISEFLRLFNNKYKKGLLNMTKLPTKKFEKFVSLLNSINKSIANLDNSRFQYFFSDAIIQLKKTVINLLNHNSITANNKKIIINSKESGLDFLLLFQKYFFANNFIIDYFISKELLLGLINVKHHYPDFKHNDFQYIISDKEFAKPLMINNPLKLGVIQFIFRINHKKIFIIDNQEVFCPGEKHIIKNSYSDKTKIVDRKFNNNNYTISRDELIKLLKISFEDNPEFWSFNGPYGAFFRGSNFFEIFPENFVCPENIMAKNRMTNGFLGWQLRDNFFLSFNVFKKVCDKKVILKIPGISHLTPIQR